MQRTDEGEIRLLLSREERTLLASLPGQLRELLDSEDPALRRLRPPAYPDDPLRDAEYRELVGDDLDRQHRQALDVLERTVDAETLDEEQASAWLSALNDLRLVLGTRLDVTEELYESGVPDGDARAPAFAVYLYLGWLEEQLVEVLAASLPES